MKLDVMLRKLGYIELRLSKVNRRRAGLAGRAFVLRLRRDTLRRAIDAEQRRQLALSIPSPFGERLTQRDVSPGYLGNLRQAGITHKNQWEALRSWGDMELIRIPHFGRKAVKAMRTQREELAAFGRLRA